MTDRSEVVDRLKGSNLGLQVSSEARSRHIAALTNALGQRPTPPPVPNRPRVRRAWAGVALVLTVLIGFSTASAAAASNAVPGDTLYRAKRVAEVLVAFTDGDLIPSNRLMELETLIARRSERATIRTARADAERALAGRDADSRLWSTWNRLALPSPPDDGAADNRPVVLAEVDWSLAEVFEAALPTGDVITVAVPAGAPDIVVTGPGEVAAIAGGWHLSSDRVAYEYLIEVTDRGVTSVVSSTENGTGGEQAADAEAESGREREFDAAAGTEDRVGAGPTTSAAPGSPLSPLDDAAEPDAEQIDDRDPGAPTPSTTSPGLTTSPSSTAAEGTTTTTSSTTDRPTATTIAPPTTPTTPSPTTSTTAPPTSTTPTGPWTVFLLNPGSGSTSSSERLPLGAGPIVGGLLPNYDTDRDDEPGLLLAKGGAGLSTSDPTKHQDWEWTFEQPTRLDGSARFTIWLGAKDFAGGESIGVQVAVDLCSPGCVRVGTGQWSGVSLSRYRGVTINLGAIDTLVTAGSTLRLRIVVPDALATTDLWFAYDTVGYPSRLVVE